MRASTPGSIRSPRRSVQHAAVKRFLDRFRGDPQYRTEVEQDRSVPEEWVEIADTLRRRHWRPFSTANEYSSPDPEVSCYLEWRAGQWDIVRQCQEGAATGNQAYGDWRSRQIGRLATQTSYPQWESLSYSPYAIELTRGCSIGCRYCGLAAAPLSGVYVDTLENQQRFAEILGVLKDFFGRGAAHGILYWATEPFDNPGYEGFLRSFFDCHGVTPPTTTAAWQRNIPRAKRFLHQSRRHNGVGDRLSINSLEEFRLCMREFSASELESVDLVMQHPEAEAVYCASGRGAVFSPSSPIKTFCCVTGFLINLVEGSVSLISPCRASEDWPLGYAVHRSGHFEEAGDLAGFLGDCEREIMRQRFDDDLVVSLRHDLATVETSADTRVLETADARMEITDRCELSILDNLHTPTPVGVIVDRLERSFGPAIVYYRLRKLRQFGLFEHLPRP